MKSEHADARIGYWKYPDAADEDRFFILCGWCAKRHASAEKFSLARSCARDVVTRPPHAVNFTGPLHALKIVAELCFADMALLHRRASHEGTCCEELRDGKD
jgi:hypothetical protein